MARTVTPTARERATTAPTRSRVGPVAFVAVSAVFGTTAQAQTAGIGSHLAPRCALQPRFG